MAEDFDYLDAQQLEQHFSDASKAMRCAWRKMKKHDKMFSSSIKEVANAALDAEEAMEICRRMAKDLEG